MTTDRLRLPLLEVAQAGKEITHNEALTIAEIAIQAVVESVAPAAVPTAPQPGQCWIVGTVPVDAWSGKANAIACWTAAGWRFVSAFEGLCVWSVADSVSVRREGGSWRIGEVSATRVMINGQRVVAERQVAVPQPSGGAVVDVEARAAISTLTQRLISHGLIAA